MTKIKRSRHRHPWGLKLVVMAPIILLGVYWGVSAGFGRSKDVTNRIVALGNPMARDGKTGRSLNVWDLQVFNRKVYVAGGSTVDNTGPINVWAYNPATQRFNREYQVAEEAIEHFRVFGNQLYIPAADPRNPDRSKFYRRGINQPWQQYASDTIKLAHVRDLVQTNRGEILMVGNNRQVRQPTQPAAAITTDNGQSFQGAGLNNPAQPALNWFFSVFSYRGSIFAPTSLLRDRFNWVGTIAVYDSTQKQFTLNPNLSNAEFIPLSQIGPQVGRQGPQIIYRLWHPIEFRGTLVYPVRSYSFAQETYRSAYMNSIGFYVKPSLGRTPFSVTFPDGTSMGEDVLLIGDRLYVLANAKVSAQEFMVYVYQTQTPTEQQSWREVLRFKSPNKARSFEYLNRSFYFGLGQDHGEPVGQAGTLLKVQL